MKPPLDAARKPMTDQRRIPLSFAQARARLSWHDILVGLREQWLVPADAIAAAVARVDDGSDNEDELALAAVLTDSEEGVPLLVSRLAGDGTCDAERESRLVWMRILLSWLFDHRHDHADPLSLVEGIYADFGYPEEISHLVRFNPPGPNESSIAQNDDMLLQRLGEYLSAPGSSDHG